jgi:hypothetical protein
MRIDRRIVFASKACVVFLNCFVARKIPKARSKSFPYFSRVGISLPPCQRGTAKSFGRAGIDARNSTASSALLVWLPAGPIGA